jgi:hypothetical protein
VGESPEWEKVKLLHLLCSYVSVSLATVTCVYGKQSREPIEVLLAIDVIDVVALSASDDWHVFVFEQAIASEVHPEVRLGRFLQHGWGDFGSGLAGFNQREFALGSRSDLLEWGF